jgi:hypothetical protein
MSDQITAMVATHHLPEESMPWMTEARGIFGALVVFIDENRVTPGTESRARSVATRVHSQKFDTWYDGDRGAMARACESDWVFVIDYDEQLSPEWHHDAWRQILNTTELTHFWCPRRWVVPGGRYITSSPLWPDVQLRLLRNGIAGTAFPTKLHDLIYVPGRPGLFQHLGLYHHTLSLWSRAAREEKVRSYEALRPGGGLRRYYLYEDYSYRTAELPEAAVWEADGEVLQMDALTPDEIAAISLEVGAVPVSVGVAEAFWIDATVKNGTNRPLVAFPPYAVRLSYHWLDASTRQVVVFDGERSELFPCVPANHSMRYSMRIEAPAVPGKYLLQATMLQESVGWFEYVQPAILREFAMLVQDPTRFSGPRPTPDTGERSSP